MLEEMPETVVAVGEQPCKLMTACSVERRYVQWELVGVGDHFIDPFGSKRGNPAATDRATTKKR